MQDIDTHTSTTHMLNCLDPNLCVLLEGDHKCNSQMCSPQTQTVNRCNQVHQYIHFLPPIQQNIAVIFKTVILILKFIKPLTVIQALVSLTSVEEGDDCIQHIHLSLACFHKEGRYICYISREKPCCDLHQNISTSNHIVK